MGETPEPSMPAQIGPYRVERELGRGGMGVVYLALDPSLLRRVAIKTLPDALAQGSGRTERFEREARLLASINHPNIAIVYNLERTAAGSVYLVMEYIDGESLAGRFRRGPIPLPEALSICRAVAKALDAAHARGVIHRDLKPPNVMVSEEGIVKVLDFGLATRTEAGQEAVLPSSEKPVAPASPSSFAGEAVTLDPELTSAGEILGTPGYLSPEQARGLPAGRQADVFAFGCLLYECLTSRPAFGGTTVQDLLQGVLQGEPDWGLLPAGIPESIRQLIVRCLKKDPGQRPESMAEVDRLLEQAMEPPSAAGEQRAHNIPQDLTTFIGREESLPRILELQRSTSLLTLTGSGGCGKTRLAQRAALDLLPSFPDGVWLVGLASVSDPSGVAASVASVLRVRESPGRPLTQAVVEGIGSKRLLLVLDNCEHLVEACAALAQELVQACPNLRILATSREILGVPGELSFRVPSLSLPDTVPEIGAGDLERFEACRLFVERAGAAGSALRVGDAEARSIARICRRLDGIPLAIELAAARTRLLGVEQIERRLDDRFRLLTGGSRTALPRHQTLRATLDWSYALLTEPEQDWLRTLSVFAGDWSLEGALAVGGNADEIEVLDVLTHLIDKSLVNPEPGAEPPRYRMLETVRQYAQERCEEGESAGLRARHLDYYVGLIERARPHLFGGAEQNRWLDLLDIEHENCVAAVHASERVEGGCLKGLKLVVLLAQFWYLRGHNRLARTLLLRALEQEGPRDSTPEEEWLNWRAGALNAAAHFLNAEGDFARSRSLIDEAVRIRRRIGPPLDLARVLFTLGANFWMLDRYAEAREAHEEALVLAREQGHRDMVAACLNALGAGLYAEGDLQGARRHFEESLALRRELEDRPNTALVLNNLGSLAALQGDLEAARDYQEEALAIQRDLKNLSGIVAVLTERGSLLAERGEPDAAFEDFAEALEIAHRLGERPNVAGLYTRLAALHLRGSDPGLAAAPLRRALEGYGEMGAAQERAHLLTLVAVLAAKAGEPGRAARLFGVAEMQQTGHPFQAFAGEAALIEDGRAAARQSLGEAAWDAASAAGRALALPEGLAEAVASLERTGRKLVT